jgi:hypothetical protein
MIHVDMVVMCSAAIEAGRRSMASGYDKKETVDIIYVPAGHGVSSFVLKTCISILVGLANGM